MAEHQAGSVDAFHELYAAHFDRLLAYCLHRLGGDRWAAEDIAQEAFVKALGSLDGFGGDRRFYAWLKVIARRLIADRLRRAEIEARAYSRAERLESAQAADPAVVVMDDLDQRVAQRALASLPAHYRQVILLRESVGLTYAGVAERMNIQPTSVRPLLARARAAFRHEYQRLSNGAMSRLGGLIGASPTTLRRMRDRLCVRMSSVPDPSVLAIPAMTVLLGLGSVLLPPPESHPADTGSVGVSRPPSSSPLRGGENLGAADTADGTVHPKGATRDPGQRLVIGAGAIPVSRGSLRDGVASVGTESQQFESDRDRARRMPYYFEAGPWYWGVDPAQAGHEASALADEVRNTRPTRP